MQRSGLAAYAGTAVLARSATEAVPPAILLVTLTLGFDPATGPLLVAALSGAAAVGGPVVGAALDRATRPRRGFAVSLLSMALALAALAVTLGGGPQQAVTAVALAAALSFVAGWSWPAISGAWSAQLPAIVTTRALPRAYSIDAGTYSVATVVGPPLAAAALGLGSLAPLLVAVAFLLAALATLPAVPVRTRAGGHERASLLAGMRDGMVAIVGRPALRRTTITTTLAFGGQAGLVVATPLVSQRLTGGLEFTGAILGAFAVGGVVAAAVYVRRPVRRPDVTVAVSTAVAGLALAAVGLAPTPAVALAAAALMGATEPAMLSSMFVVRTREAPARVRSMVFTASASLRLTAFALVSAALGAVIAWGPGPVALIGAAIHLAGVAVGIAAGPRVRRRGVAHSHLRS